MAILEARENAGICSIRWFTWHVLRDEALCLFMWLVPILDPNEPSARTILAFLFHAGTRT